MTKLEWQTGEPPEDELVIYEKKCILPHAEWVETGTGHVADGEVFPDTFIDDVDEIGKIYVTDIDRWVLYSDFLKVVE